MQSEQKKEQNKRKRSSRLMCGCRHTIVIHLTFFSCYFTVHRNALADSMW